MIIDGTKIGHDQPPYVVAEISCNHAGYIGNAMRLIEDAKEAGANAAKVQCYDQYSMTIPGLCADSGEWQYRDLFDLYSKTATKMEWMEPLFDHARKVGITLFSSVFCMRGLRVLESVGCPAYKISSFELCWEELLEAVGKTRKPVIASLGMAKPEDILAAIRTLTMAGCPSIAFLHCVSKYPAPYNELNLSMISHLRTWLGLPIGFSDHTHGGAAAEATVAGACILERHLRNVVDETEDYLFSDTIGGLNGYVYGAREAYESLHSTTDHEPPAQLQRSIYCVKDMAAGEKFTRETVAVIRPGYGLHPRELENVLDSKAAYAIKRGEPITQEKLV